MWACFGVWFAVEKIYGNERAIGYTLPSWQLDILLALMVYLGGEKFNAACLTCYMIDS